MDISNQVRGYSYLAGVFNNREGDPFCSSCNAFHSTLLNAKESILQFDRDHAPEIEKLPSELSLFFFVAKSGITGVKQPVHPVGQKKAGNCRLPEGVCFVKSSLALLQKI